jgi:hypothetical protein
VWRTYFGKIKILVSFLKPPVLEDANTTAINILSVCRVTQLIKENYY